MPLYSIGHSNHSTQQFLDLLATANIGVVADVRSLPGSRWAPHFNAGRLRLDLKAAGLAYVPMGAALGGRPADPAAFANGAPSFEKRVRMPAFQTGIGRLIAGASRHAIAILCRERHPLNCHRCRLVGRALLRAGVDTQHILPEGERLSQSAIETQLLAGLGGDDLFTDDTERLSLAYRRRA